MPLTIAFVALVIGAIAMGVSPVFVRQGEVGPFASAFWRTCLALPLLGLWATIENRNKTARLNKSPHAAIPSTMVLMERPTLLAGIFFAGDLIFWHLAIHNTTMANATLMSCLAPVWVIMLSARFLREKAQANAYWGLILCLVGASLLIGASYKIAPDRILGDFFGLVTSVFFGLYFLAVRKARRTLGTGVLIFRSTLITTIILLAVALLAKVIDHQVIFPKNHQGWANLMALGILSHAGGQGLLSYSLGILSAIFSSLVIFIEALAGAFFGYIVFGEALTWLQLLGACAILAGIFIARPKGKNQH